MGVSLRLRRSDGVPQVLAVESCACPTMARRTSSALGSKATAPEAVRGDTGVMGRRLTTDEFVEQACAVHGHRNDYSMVDYVQRSTPVTVVCREHGPFETLPWRHVSRREGCPLCADIAAQDALRAAEERWVERAREVHGDRYEYPAPGYRGTGYRVKIVCPEHGLFEQFAANHLQGRGCQRCGRERAAEKRRGSDGDLHDRGVDRASDRRAR